MTIAAIVYSSDNFNATRMALEYLRENSTIAKLYVVDNGSTHPYSVIDDGIVLPIADKIIRYEQNIGGNAVFHRWMTDNWFDESPDYLAFLHCDLMVREQGWDERVVRYFAADEKLDLIGFAGSTEIDAAGGRGLGTMLNFRGDHYSGYGWASPAEVHGRRMSSFVPAAVVDHCAMILRRTTLEQLTPQEGHYAPEHFYDRLLSCEIIQRGGHIGVLGIDCDHFSGGIGDGMSKADELRRRWLTEEGIKFDPDNTYAEVYHESQRRFFERYKGFFPFQVDHEHKVHR